ncbi:MAG: nucleotidyltransferase family protein, partial [Bacteroidales bacterium]|nr:nucleotidyltransferase family protein [Bacteroidales bacterium]
MSHLRFKNEKEVMQFLSRHRLFSGDFILNDAFNQKSRSWREFFKNKVTRSLHLASVLTNLILKLREQQIDIIPLKGPLLAISLYGDIGKRYSVDLDLMVRDTDVVKIKGSLDRIGFKQNHPNLDLSKKQWNYYFRWKKDISLVNRELGVFLELHTGIYYNELLSHQKERLFFDNLAQETFGGVTVPCMNRDNTFLYLTYHGAQHMYFRLFWLRDVAEALKRWELDHSKILNNAYELGIERLLGVSLELAREFFDSAIPEEYNDLLENNTDKIKKLKNLCVKRILGPEELTFIGK